MIAYIYKYTLNTILAYVPDFFVICSLLRITQCHLVEIRRCDSSSLKYILDDFIQFDKYLCYTLCYVISKVPYHKNKEQFLPSKNTTLLDYKCGNSQRYALGKQHCRELHPRRGPHLHQAFRRGFLQWMMLVWWNAKRQSDAKMVGQREQHRNKKKWISFTKARRLGTKTKFGKRKRQKISLYGNPRLVIESIEHCVNEIIFF